MTDTDHDLHAQVESDIMRMQIKYGTLLTRIKKSLQQRNHSPSDLAAHLSALRTFPAVHTRDHQYLADKLKELSEASSLINFYYTFRLLVISRLSYS